MNRPCIRNEVRTRVQHNLVGNEKPLPDHIGESWCGNLISGTWFFQSTDHAFHSMASAGSPTPCPKCLRFLREIITAELGDESERMDE